MLLPQAFHACGRSSPRFLHYEGKFDGWNARCSSEEKLFSSINKYSLIPNFFPAVPECGKMGEEGVF